MKSDYGGAKEEEVFVASSTSTGTRPPRGNTIMSHSMRSRGWNGRSSLRQHLRSVKSCSQLEVLMEGGEGKAAKSKMGSSTHIKSSRGRKASKNMRTSHPPRRSASRQSRKVQVRSIVCGSEESNKEGEGAQAILVRQVKEQRLDGSETEEVDNPTLGPLSGAALNVLQTSQSHPGLNGGTPAKVDVEKVPKLTSMTDPTPQLAGTRPKALVGSLSKEEENKNDTEEQGLNAQLPPIPVAAPPMLGRNQVINSGNSSPEDATKSAETQEVIQPLPAPLTETSPAVNAVTALLSSEEDTEESSIYSGFSTLSDHPTTLDPQKAVNLETGSLIETVHSMIYFPSNEEDSEEGCSIYSGISSPEDTLKTSEARESFKPGAAPHFENINAVTSTPSNELESKEVGLNTELSPRPVQGNLLQENPIDSGTNSSEDIPNRVEAEDAIKLDIVPLIGTIDAARSSQGNGEDTVDKVTPSKVTPSKVTSLQEVASIFHRASSNLLVECRPDNTSSTTRHGSLVSVSSVNEIERWCSDHSATNLSRRKLLVRVSSVNGIERCSDHSSTNRRKSLRRDDSVGEIGHSCPDYSARNRLRSLRKQASINKIKSIQNQTVKEGLNEHGNDGSERNPTRPDRKMLRKAASTNQLLDQGYKRPSLQRSQGQIQLARASSAGKLDQNLSENPRSKSPGRSRASGNQLSCLSPGAAKKKARSSGPSRAPSTRRLLGPSAGEVKKPCRSSRHVPSKSQEDNAIPVGRGKRPSMRSRRSSSETNLMLNPSNKQRREVKSRSSGGNRRSLQRAQSQGQLVDQKGGKGAKVRVPSTAIGNPSDQSQRPRAGKSQTKLSIKKTSSISTDFGGGKKTSRTLRKIPSKRHDLVFDGGPSKGRKSSESPRRVSDIQKHQGEKPSGASGRQISVTEGRLGDKGNRRKPKNRPKRLSAFISNLELESKHDAGVWESKNGQTLHQSAPSLDSEVDWADFRSEDAIVPYTDPESGTYQEEGTQSARSIMDWPANENTEYDVVKMQSMHPERKDAKGSVVKTQPKLPERKAVEGDVKIQSILPKKKEASKVLASFKGVSFAVRRAIQQGRDMRRLMSSESKSSEEPDQDTTTSPKQI